MMMKVIASDFLLSRTEKMQGIVEGFGEYKSWQSLNQIFWKRFLQRNQDAQYQILWECSVFVLTWFLLCPGKSEDCEDVGYEGK